MSASFSASTSFTPSPVIATTCPRDWSASTIARFCCGVTRPKIACVSSTSASSSPPSGSAFASNGVVGARRAPRAARPRPTVSRVVAADDLDVDALLGEVRERRRRRLAAPGPSRITSATGTSRSGAAICRRCAASVRPRSTTRRPDSACARAFAQVGVVVRRAQQHVGRAEHPRPPGRRSRRRSTCGPTRTGPVAAASHPSGASGKLSRIASRVAFGCGFGGGERRERVTVRPRPRRAARPRRRPARPR